MSIEKRIITWQWGNNKPTETSPGNDEFTTSRAFIFGNYGDNFAHYCELVAEAKKDFPDLDDKEITVSEVLESSYMKHFVYISFLVPENHKQAGYADWNRFDFR